MTYTEAYRHYLDALRKNPQTAAPAMRMDTIEDFHAWKAEMRAFDAARLELKLATPAEIQAENSALKLKGKTGRIVRHASFA
jgi:hypothetical protein